MNPRKPLDLFAIAIMVALCVLWGSQPISVKLISADVAPLMQMGVRSAIAAVVLGGTNILGGKGNYLGTIAGVILITLLQSILSVMQIAEFGRQIIYGVIIVGMLLLYGREKSSR